MSAELSKEANDLVREGQSALRPTAGDKQRVLAALQARIQHEAAGEGGTPSAGREAPPDAGRLDHASSGNVDSPPSPSVLKFGKLAILAGGLIASFAAISGYLSRSDQAELAPASPVLATSSEPVSTHSQATETSAPELVRVESLPLATVERPTATRSSIADNLAAEAALLSQAEKALHAGNLNRALVLTTEHRNKFPKGLMIQERVNIRVQALCGLGRDNEADNEYARFRRSPKIQPGQACRR